MAYRDENGRITIDEYAAHNDMRKLQEAAEILSDALSALEMAEIEANHSKGRTALEMANKARELRDRIQHLHDNILETRTYIRHIVNYYRVKDEYLKQKMASRN